MTLVDTAHEDNLSLNVGSISKSELFLKQQYSGKGRDLSHSPLILVKPPVTVELGNEEQGSGLSPLRVWRFPMGLFPCRGWLPKSRI